MPWRPSAATAAWKAVSDQLRYEHSGPLKPLSLVHRHDLNRIGRRITAVLPALRINLIRLILEEARKRCIFLYRLRVEVNALKVGDGLAKLAKIVEDRLAPL